MIQEFVKRFDEKRDDIRAELGNLLDKKGWELEYDDIVRTVLEAVNGKWWPNRMDIEGIHLIDDGDYQGTLVYVIPEDSYQPSDYWYVRIAYGSCSGCDTLQCIMCCFDWEGEEREKVVDDLFTLALHVVQKLKKMEGEIVYD